MNLSNETKVGILAVLGIALLIIGYAFLKGNNLFSKTTAYYAVYSNTDGLSTSDPVTFNGLPIGKISALEILNEGEGKILARVTLDKDVKIPQNSTFQIYSLDLLGEKAVKLVLGDSKEFAQSGDTLKGEIAASLTETVSGGIIPIKQKVESTMDSIMRAVRIILEKQKQDSIAKTK